MFKNKVLAILFFLLVYSVLEAYSASYKDYNEIVDEINNLAIGSSGFARAFNAGKTVNGTNIRCIVISSNATVANNPDKPDVIIIGTIHGREWIASEVCLKLAEHLIDNRVDDTAVVSEFRGMTIKRLLESAEIVIVPVLNADGYSYSRNEHTPGGSPDDVDENWSIVFPPEWDPNLGLPLYQDWRKNRRDLSLVQESTYTEAGESGDVGVDCNRNFPFKWHPPVNAITDPTGYETYRGDIEGSESEVQVQISLFNSRDVVASIDYHSYGKLVLYPWGYTSALISASNEFIKPNTNTLDVDLYKKIGEKIAGEIGGGYVAMRAANLYSVSGASIDWIYSQKHIATFTIELASQFQPPITIIDQIADRNIKGARWLMFWAADRALRVRPTIRP